MGPNTVVELTLPHLAHPCAAVLSTSVRMCAKVSILGVKNIIYASREVRSRSFMVMSLVGLVSVTSLV